MTDHAGSAAVRLALTTAPSRAVAEELGTTLVRERLAACANLLDGVHSIFWWQGEVQREDEVLVLLKTTGERVEALRARLAELHPYDVPEVLVMPVELGHEPYLAWVRAEVEPR